MLVKMIANAKGSEDGFTVRTFDAGRVYDIQRDLAVVFVNQMHVAMELSPKPTFEILEAVPVTPKKKRGRPKKVKK